jgi:serine/tyrosine/threonine adenylyltransferase
MMKSALPILNLGDDFYSPVQGGKFLDPKLRYRNQTQAKQFSLDSLSDSEWVNHFGRFVPLKGNLETPLAMKYHGHQFQYYNPDLGDGRGFVFAQFIKDNHLFELGTKGSGQTPYSRRGDGRLTLKGAVRELLATDFLDRQKVLTSHTFSIVETGEQLERHDEPSPTRSAVLFRLSRGHIRIGNFQRAYFEQNKLNIEKLIDYSLKNFYPELTIPDDLKTKSELFFNSVTIRLADLCASYMVAGFVHGVLNTDNMNVSGESFDYGPYRFLPYYDPYFTAAYFDQQGLYSFGRQPPTFLWNLDQFRIVLKFAEPNADFSKLEEDFATYFNVFFTSRFFKKLALKPNTASHETELANAFMDLTPEYYTNSTVPILDITKITKAPFADITKSAFFANTQAIIENFFKDIYQDKSKNFELAFYEMLNWSQRLKPTDYFSQDTLKQVAQHTSLHLQLSDDQIQLRRQTLVIDEIESIWDAIAKNDNWNALYQRVNKN